MEVVVHHGFVIVIRRASLEIYGIPPLPASDIVISPVAQHNWQRLDSVSVAPQAPRRGNRLPALRILIRFGSTLPWASFLSALSEHIQLKRSISIATQLAPSFYIASKRGLRCPSTRGSNEPAI